MFSLKIFCNEEIISFVFCGKYSMTTGKFSNFPTEEYLFLISSLFAVEAKAELNASAISFLFVFFSFPMPFGGCAFLPPRAPGMFAAIHENCVPRRHIIFLGTREIPLP